MQPRKDHWKKQLSLWTLCPDTVLDRMERAASMYHEVVEGSAPAQRREWEAIRDTLFAAVAAGRTKLAEVRGAGGLDLTYAAGPA